MTVRAAGYTLTTRSPILIGADPEFFLKRNGHFVSGHQYNCGSKGRPLQTTHGFIQNDGLAVECNVIPSKSRKEFINNVNGVVNDLELHLQRMDPRLVLVKDPVGYFTPRYMASLPAAARQLGCDPDFDPYIKHAFPRPDGKNHFRTAAGHIHIGWCNDVNPQNTEHFNLCCDVARQLDYYVGLATLLWDKDTVRRNLYGKPGAFRPTSYGLEYRVPSNVWTRTNQLIGIVYDLTRNAIHDFIAGNRVDLKWGSVARYALSNNQFDWPRAQPVLFKELGL